MPLPGAATYVDRQAQKPAFLPAFVPTMFAYGSESLMEVYRKIQGNGGFQLVRVLRFRLMCFQRPLGPWRASKAEAEMDALAERMATRERGMVWITVPAWIKQSDPTEETEADLQIRRTRNLRVVAELKTRRVGRRFPQEHS